MSDNVTLQIAIAKAMIAEEPGLMVADVRTSIRCAHALAANLGCVMASMLVKEGETKFEAALQLILETVRKNAHGTVGKANQFATDPSTWTRQ